MIRLIKVILSTVMITSLLFSSSVYADTSPEYVTRYDFVTAFFNEGVCNVELYWDQFNYNYSACKSREKDLFINPTDYREKNFNSYPMVKVVKGDPEDIDISDIITDDYVPTHICIPMKQSQENLLNMDSAYDGLLDELREKGYEVYNDFLLEEDLKNKENYICCMKVDFMPESSFADVDLGSDDFPYITILGTDLSFEISRGLNGTLSCRNVNKSATSFLCAEMTGILTGYGDNTFRPKEYITREDAFVILYRYFNSPYFMTYYEEPVDFELPEFDESILNSFSDSDEISDYAREAVSVLTQMGFTETDYTCSFNPKDYLTKNQLYDLLKRHNDALQGLSVRNRIEL